MYDLLLIIFFYNWTIHVILAIRMARLLAQSKQENFRSNGKLIIDGDSTARDYNGFRVSPGFLPVATVT